ncbi:MAG: Ig domain-containing protein [Actinomycetes bacterium]
MSDRGDSLVEVIIASVIMALLGSVIVGSIAMSQPLSERFNQTGIALTKLSAAAQQIQMATFKDCTAINTPSYPFTLGVTPAAPSTNLIANGDLPLGQVGTSYSAQLVGPSGWSNWNVVPALPTGLALNSSTGVISGTPTVEVTKAYRFTISNSDASLKVSKSINLSTITARIDVPSITGTGATATAVWNNCSDLRANGDPAGLLASTTQQITLTTMVGTSQKTLTVMKSS